jgi:hypothetical protein
LYLQYLKYREQKADIRLGHKINCERGIVQNGVSPHLPVPGCNTGKSESYPECIFGVQNDTWRSDIFVLTGRRCEVEWY